jgi:transposase
MDYFAGLDVSVKDTSVCIVDDASKIVREIKVVSEPDALLQVLRNPAYCFKRIGLEAGPLSQWLFSALGEANLPDRTDDAGGTLPSSACEDATQSVP